MLAAGSHILVRWPSRTRMSGNRLMTCWSTWSTIGSYRNFQDPPLIHRGWIGGSSPRNFDDLSAVSKENALIMNEWEKWVWLREINWNMITESVFIKQLLERHSILQTLNCWLLNINPDSMLLAWGMLSGKFPTQKRKVPCEHSWKLWDYISYILLFCWYMWQCTHMWDFIPGFYV